MQTNDQMYCDLCRKKIWILFNRHWNPFNKIIRCVVRTKEHVWVEYYHMKCLIKSGRMIKIKKERAGRWDDKDPSQPTTNVTH